MSAPGTTQQLVSTDGTTQTFVVLDDQGNIVGYNIVDNSPQALNRATLTQRAQSAISANNAFLNITSPTQLQVLQQVQLLTRENTAIIDLILSRLDSLTGT